jgi:glutamine synthetase
MGDHETVDAFDRLHLVWTDLNGVPRGVAIPADEYGAAREEGVAFANSVAEFTLEPGLPSDPAYPAQGGDMVAHPDDDSLVPVAWDTGVGLVFSDLTDVSGTPLPLCTRSLLHDVVSQYHDLGYQPVLGLEPEFSVLDTSGDDPGPFNSRTSYDLDALDRASDLIRDWTAAMETAGYAVLGVHQESQPGQYELNLAYDDPVAAADGVVLLRHALKTVARRHDRDVTMMPRPHSGEDANGLHFHLSLWDRDREQNLFAGSDRHLSFPAGQHPRDGGLSSLALHFIAGIVEHLPALTAVCNPTVNSYKRLVPGIWAPCNTAWGPDNRSVNLRVPPELGDGARVEFRSPDSAANPYLAAAATLAAGLDGIRSRLSPPEPTTGDAYRESESHDRLPRTLLGALEALEDDEVLRDALGELLVEEYVTIKREEFDRYQHHVSDWERAEYADEF